MARLTQICFSTLALLVVATTAAPCHDNVDIIEHEHGHDHTVDYNGDSGEVWDEFDNGSDLDGGANWGNGGTDEGTGCVEYDPCAGGDNWDNGNGDNWDNGNGDNWDNGNGDNWDNGNGDNWDDGNGSNGGHHSGHNDGHGSDNGGNYSGNDGGAGIGGGDDASLIDVKAGYIGLGDVYAQNALDNAVDLKGFDVHNLIQDVGAL